MLDVDDDAGLESPDFDPLDFESLDFDSLDFDSLDFDSLDFESLDFESDAFASLDLLRLTLAFAVDDPPSDDFDASGATACRDARSCRSRSDKTRALEHESGARRHLPRRDLPAHRTRDFRHAIADLAKKRSNACPSGQRNS